MISSFSKCIFLIFLSFSLSACGKTPSIETTPEKTGSQSDKVEYATSSWASTVTGAVYGTWLQDIIKLQIKEWPQAIESVNCDTYSGQDREYCNNEKKKIEEYKKEITWESVLKKWPEYIKDFDCSTILSSFGQKYCSEYKLSLPK